MEKRKRAQESEDARSLWEDIGVHLIGWGCGTKNIEARTLSRPRMRPRCASSAGFCQSSKIVHGHGSAGRDGAEELEHQKQSLRSRAGLEGRHEPGRQILLSQGWRESRASAPPEGTLREDLPPPQLPANEAPPRNPKEALELLEPSGRGPLTHRGQQDHQDPKVNPGVQEAHGRRGRSAAGRPESRPPQPLRDAARARCWSSATAFSAAWARRPA